MEENQTVKQEKPEEVKAPKESKPSIFRRLKSWMGNKLEKIRRFIIECKRVLRVTKKPDRQEFTTIVKISSIGMAIIGLIGFAVFFLKELIVAYF